MMAQCKWCGVYFVQTTSELEYCSGKCKEIAEEKHEKKSQNIFANMA